MNIVIDNEIIFEPIGQTGLKIEYKEFLFLVDPYLSNSVEELDAPVRFVSSLQTPVPFHPDLEANYLAKSRLKESVQELMDY